MHTFLSPSKEKCERPIGRQVPLPRRSRRVSPHPGQGVCACRRIKGLSAHPLETFGHRSWRDSPAVVGVPSPQQRIFLRHSCRTPMQAGGFPRGKQSARPALPCAPLVGYLNFRLLSAIGSHTRRVHDFLRLPRRKYQQPRHGGAPSIPQPLFPKIKPSAP